MSGSALQKPGQDKEFVNRLIVLVVIFYVCLFALLYTASYIQILKNPEFVTKTKNNRERTVRIAPIRGKIFSADGKVLADNKTIFSVYVNPYSLSRDFQLRQESLIYLSHVLDYNYSDIEKILANKAKSRTDIMIADNIPFEAFMKIRENLERMPGISVRERNIRYYPNHSSLSHVLGYVGPINAEEYSLKKQNGYEPNDILGKMGLENYYEEELRGREGKKVYVVDARMVIQDELKNKEVEPKAGDELILSVDMKLQKTAEEILCDRTGTILVMRPINGEILAMTSYPGYDPNIYILDTEENMVARRAVELDVGGTPLYNRNIQTLYPAASLFKIVTSTAIVNENIVPLDKTFYCGGVYRLNRQLFGCWNRGGHGNLDLKGAIVNSCDVYFYNVAKSNIDIEKIYEYATMYGFGKPTGVDLPFEKSGLIPNRQWKKEQKESWHTGDTLNSIIGQGDVKITPLQLAVMLSAICNKGVAYKPHFLKELRSSETGEIVRQHKLEKAVDMDNIPVWVFDTLEDQLRAVVSTQRGTAHWSFYGNNNVYVGKTGTAEVGVGVKKNTHSLFGGYGPLDFPLEDRVVVMILIENDNSNRLKYAANLANLLFWCYAKDKTYREAAKRFNYPVLDSYR